MNSKVIYKLISQSIYLPGILFLCMAQTASAHEELAKQFFQENGQAKTENEACYVSNQKIGTKAQDWCKLVQRRGHDRSVYKLLELPETTEMRISSFLLFPQPWNCQISKYYTCGLVFRNYSAIPESAIASTADLACDAVRAKFKLDAAKYCQEEYGLPATRIQEVSMSKVAVASGWKCEMNFSLDCGLKPSR